VRKIKLPTQTTDSPGCAAGVYKDGQTVYEHGYGTANLNDNVPITPETKLPVSG
jgi:CubicO group peptidase (beta-lactamase class C family)